MNYARLSARPNAVFKDGYISSRGYFYYLIDHLLLQLGKREAQSETHLANET